MSTVETPSISVLLEPPPPSRPGLLPLTSTPGASEVRLVKLRLLIGRFCDRVGRDGERALAALRLNQRASAATVTVSARPPTSMTIGGTATRSPGLIGTPDRSSVLNPSIVT